jgi:hypothetical protein
MPKSKIILDIVENKIKLSDALYRVILIATELENTELLEWAKQEVNGYKDKEKLPEYRLKSSSVFKYSGLNGPLQINQASLDISFLSQETLERVSEFMIFEDINSIEEKAKSDTDVFRRDVSFLAGEVYQNSSNGFTGIECTSISQIISKQHFASVFNNVKTKLIDILMLLEEEVGNLDKKDISGKVKNKRNKVNDKISLVLKSVEIQKESLVNNMLWKIVIPILIAISGGVLVLIIQKLFL